MKNEIRSLTENEVDDVSGAVIPAWLAVLAGGVATNAIYDGLKEAGVFAPIDWQGMLGG
jgi:hypothetical protein